MKQEKFPSPLARARLIKLKPGSRQSVEDWQTVMNARIAEAKESIREEGVQVESWFLTRIDNDDYLIAYMRMKDDAASGKPAASHAIDAAHRAFKEQAWDKSFNGACHLLLDVHD